MLDQSETRSAKILQMYERFKLFDKPFAFIYGSLIFMIIASLQIYEFTLKPDLPNAVSCIGALLFSFGFQGLGPYILSNPYNNFVKKIPVHEVATPSYIFIFVCNYISTIIYMVMTIFGVIFLASNMTKVDIISSVLYTFANLLSLIALPMPFLVIGSSTSYLVNQCKKAKLEKQINIVAETLKSYNTLTRMCGPILLIIFTMNVIALITLSYITAISLKGCSLSAFDITGLSSYYIAMNVIVILCITLTLMYFAHSVDECYQHVKSLKSLTR